MKSKKGSVWNVILMAIICIFAYVLQFSVLRGNIKILIPGITVFVCSLIVCRKKLNFVNIIKLIVSSFAVLLLFDLIAGTLLASFWTFILGTFIYEFIRTVGYVMVMIISCVWVSKKKLRVFGKRAYITALSLSFIYAVLCQISSIIGSIQIAFDGTLLSFLTHLTLTNPIDFVCGVLFYVIIFYVSARLGSKLCRR